MEMPAGEPSGGARELDWFLSHSRDCRASPVETVKSSPNAVSCLDDPKCNFNTNAHADVVGCAIALPRRSALKLEEEVTVDISDLSYKLSNVHDGNRRKAS